jgi:anti-sigma factor RsiW
MQENDRLEFLLTQYLDGSLPAPERQSLEARLASDPSLRKTLEEYAQLDELLRTGMPVPRDQRDDLGHRISSAVSMLPDPRPTLRLAPFIAAGAALAACVLVVVTLRFTPQPAPVPVATTIEPTPAPVVVASAQVIGPMSETPTGHASASITLGGPPSDAAMTFDTAQPIVSQPSRVFIASAADASNHITH